MPNNVSNDACRGTGSVNGIGKYAILLFFALIAAGLMGNHFPFSILNAHFVFGSIFAMLALQVLGPGPGIAAAAVISGYTYLAWNHPWAVVTMTLEVIAVAVIIRYRGIGLVTADALYWLFLGVPLGYFCFRFGSDLPANNAMFLMTKQGINGISNALIARLLFTGLGGFLPAARISFREAISNLLMFFVLCPFLILLTMEGRIDMAEIDRRICNALLLDSRHITKGLEDWLENRKRTVARLAKLAATHSPEKMLSCLEQAHAMDGNFLRIAFVDREATIIACYPLVDELGRSHIGRSLADRSYLPVVEQTLKPMLSEVMISEFDRPDPVSIAMAPVLSGGSYHGVIEGILSFDPIRSILGIHSPDQETLYSLLDRDDNVVVTNRKDQKIMMRFDRGEGTVHPIQDGISRWIPVLPPNTSTIELWGKSFYVSTSSVGSKGGWKLILEQPVGPFQKSLYERYTGNFSILFMVLAAALVLAELSSRLLVKTTEELGSITRDLPARLASGAQLTWPRSILIEANRLILNCREMADLLAMKFAESRRMKEVLEQRVLERTEELGKSEELLNKIIDNIPIMIFLKDAAELRLVRINRAVEEQLGYSREYLVGKTSQDLLRGETAVAWSERDREALSRRRRVEVPEELLPTRHRGNRILQTTRIPLLDVQGAPRYLLSISVDITERKQNEDTLVEANQRLRSAQSAMLNIMEDLKAENAVRKKNEAERLRLSEQLQQAQKMESVGRLAGGVAHDFNNMLGIILGYTEMVLDRIDAGDPVFAEMQEIRKAAERSTEITRQLLAFARRQTIVPKVLDLNDTVESMLKMLRRLLGEDIDLAWLPGAGLWRVNMDPSQIDQLLANLCVNARDAITGTGKLTIETRNIGLDEAYCADHPDSIPGEYVLLVVSDDGCGMDKKVLERLFEPFFTTKKVGKGTGLGLATVYGIVRQNNGFVNVYSEPGHGTTFRVYIPRCEGDRIEVAAESTSELPRARGETLLLVEDETVLLGMGKAMLEKLGYRVLTASRPTDAIRLVEAHVGKIHLLMTDVVMPEMNGRELSERLLANKPGMKCLFMSGYTANVIAHHGVLDQGVHFIQKPFTMRGLAVGVRKTLDG